MRINAIAWMAAAVLAAACTSVSVKDTWKDPTYAGGPHKKLLVVGAMKSDSNRRVFEDGFSRALGAAGSAGVASYPTLRTVVNVTSAQLADAMKQAGADAVLVTRVLRVRREVDVTPGYARGGFYGGGYRGWYGGVAMAPDVDVYDVLTVESTLWNVAADKPLWSGTSEVTEPKAVSAATEDLAKALIGKMKADGII
jgi:hypothetical protein